jgi:hypothetical protein
MMNMTECFIPKGEVTKLGYIRLWNGGNRILAHRAYYEFIHGKVPEGMELDHLCNNRSCCNVGHLKAVTHTENMRRSSQTKLTPEVVRDMKAMRDAGSDYQSIGDKYKVTKQCAWLAIKGKNWRDIT